MIDSHALGADAEPTISWTLNPDQDAFYTVVARGSTSMSPVYEGLTPFATTAAIFVDIDGDGWTPPLPSLVMDRR